MKQRITADQLQQLTPSQQEKLRAWWDGNRQKGDIFICLGNDFLSGKEFVWDGHNKPFNLSIPLVSIGQCIELLNCMVNINNAFTEYPKAWCVMNMNRKKEYWAEELIDALFEVVKSIL